MLGAMSDTRPNADVGNAAGLCAGTWLDGALGRRLLACEERALLNQLDTLFGNELVQIGRWGEPRLFLQHARTHSVALLDTCAAPGVDVVGHPEQLPFCDDSIDAVLLPHTLESVASPHRVLREVDRVLRRDGCMLILALNSRGPVGARRALSMQRFPDGARRLLAEPRLRDWLALLDYHVLDVTPVLYGLPIDRGPAEPRQVSLDRWCQRWLPTVFGGAFVLRARKQVKPTALVRRPWAKRLPAADGGLARPTTRNCA